MGESITQIVRSGREKLKTSDGQYFLTSDGSQMYVRTGEEEILLLNNIFTMSAEDRTFNAS